MSSPEIKSEEPITFSELKDALNKIQERDGELSFRSGKTIDHLQHLSLISPSEVARLREAIEDIKVPRLKNIHITKIIDVRPKNLKELSVVLSGYSLTVNKENQQKILDVINA